MYYYCPKDMKLLFIRSTNGISGAEIYNENLLKGLRKAPGIEVNFLTNNKKWQQRLVTQGISCSTFFCPVHEPGTKKELFWYLLWLYPMLVVYLWRILNNQRKEKYTSIVLESMGEKLFLSSFLKLFGYRVIWIEHGPLFITDRFFFIKWLYVWKSRWADAIIAVSKDTKKDLITGGVPDIKISMIYIGIRKIASPGARNDKKRKKKNWVIGYLGSIAKEKGISMFIGAARTIIQKRAYASFCVIGNGPDLDWARNYAKRFHMQKRVIFTGYVSDPSQYMSTIDILFFPTHHHEGLSMALLESMAHGKIVVVRDIGGNRELAIDKKTGFLFQTDEEGEKILVEIITGKLSTKGIREAARAHVRKNFWMDTQVHKFIEVFRG